MGVHALQGQLDDTRKKRNFYALLGRTVPVTGICVFLTILVVHIFITSSPIFLAIGLFYLAIAIIFPMFNYAGALDIEIEALEGAISLRLTGAEASEQRAEQLFKAHEIELRRYYQQTLQHSGFIFIAGLVCIALGFAIIGLSFYLIWHSPDITNIDKIITAVFGITSGILANFIASIYMKMFAQTLGSLGDFHNKLVFTNHLHFANFILAKIADPELRDRNFAELAIDIVKNRDAFDVKTANIIKSPHKTQSIE